MFTAILLAAVIYAPTDGYVLLNGGGTSAESGSFNVDEVNVIREAFGPNVFWFRASGKDYIVRDAAALKKIDDLFLPQRELGAKQAALGQQQAALGRKQAGLGARQARAGSNIELQEKLAREQDELEKQQESLGNLQADLGNKQDQLIREAQEKLSTMTKTWIRTGLAKPLVTQVL